jgi:UDP-N-acetylglucosamine enolpyruvyl transferase
MTLGAYAAPQETVPIYHVTVVSRTLQAVNYEHMTGPTDIGFQGTILMPQAKGEATIDSKRGRTVIDARFDHIDAPTRFGAEYLTYVLYGRSPPKAARRILASWW